MKRRILELALVSAALALLPAPALAWDPISDRTPSPVRDFMSVPVWYLDYEVVVDCVSPTLPIKLHALFTGHVVLNMRTPGAALSTILPAVSKAIPPGGRAAAAYEALRASYDGSTWMRAPPPENATAAATQAWNDSALATMNATYDVTGTEYVAHARGSGPHQPLGMYMFDVDVAKKVYALSLPVVFGETISNSPSVKGEEQSLVQQQDGTRAWIKKPLERDWGVLQTYAAVDPVPESTGNAYILRGSLPDTLAPLKGYASYRLSYNSDQAATGTMRIRYTLALEPPKPASLIFYAIQDDWRPTPGPDEDTPDAENPLEIGWRVLQPPGKKVDVEEVSFHLGNVSRYPGVCMNWPAKPKIDGTGGFTVDLRFKKDLDYSSDVDWGEDGQSLRITGDTAKLGRGREVIQAFDGAAIGELVAEARLADGRVLPGTVPEDGLQPDRGKLLIPDREEGVSDIARSWRSEHAKGLADGSDQDAEPKGDGQEGDGLSVWEEYRGFMVDGKWTDTDPRKKTLFINNIVGTVAEPGIRLLERATGLEVLDRLRREERRDDNHPEARVINFNNRLDRHVVDQHCLRLRESQDPSAGVAEPIFGARFTGPPKNTDWVNVVLGMPDDRVFPDPTAPKGYSVQSDQDAMVAHELGHAIGIYHHGDRDPWTADGKFGLYWTKKSGGGGLSFLEEDGTGIIRAVRDPSMTPIDANSLFFRGRTRRRVGVGFHFGQHSGDVECFMRYNAAVAHPLVADPQVRDMTGLNEPPGRTLCSSPAGTRFNLPSTAPESWYSGADYLRGDCVHQFVISDAHEIKYRDDKAQASARAGRRAP